MQLEWDQQSGLSHHGYILRIITIPLLFVCWLVHALLLFVDCQVLLFISNVRQSKHFKPQRLVVSCISRLPPHAHGFASRKNVCVWSQNGSECFPEESSLRIQWSLMLVASRDHIVVKEATKIQSRDRSIMVCISFKSETSLVCLLLFFSLSANQRWSWEEVL